MLISPAFKENNIAMICATNDYYAPYLAVMLQSVISNTKIEYNYDLIVCYFSLNNDNQKKISSFVENRTNVSIRFLDANAIDDLESDKWKVGKLSKETYIRMLVPFLLPQYDKVIYMDGDMINCRDIAELFNINIEKYLLGAVKLMGTEAMFNSHQLCDTSMCFWNNKNLNACRDYFNAGCLLMNLSEFRKKFAVEEIVHQISLGEYPLLDQDLLNIICNGYVKWVDAGWNIYPYTQEEFTNVLSMCSEKWRSYFEDGYHNIGNIHFTTPVKPWLQTRGTYSASALLFWSYAINNVYYQELQRRREEWLEQQESLDKIIHKTWNMFVENATDVPLYVHGYGKRGREIVKQLKGKFNIRGIIDKKYNNVKQKDIDEVAIVNKEIINNQSDVCILISMDRWQEVAKDYIRRGYNNIFSYACLQRREMRTWELRQEDYKNVAWLFGELKDEKSKKILSALLEKRDAYAKGDLNIKCLDIYEGSSSLEAKTYKIDVLNFDETKNVMTELERLKEFIKTFKPRLYIDISRNYSDLWEVPKRLIELVPEYKIYLRHHGNGLYNTVLYVIK